MNNDKAATVGSIRQICLHMSDSASACQVEPPA